MQEYKLFLTTFFFTIKSYLRIVCLLRFRLLPEVRAIPEPARLLPLLHGGEVLGRDRIPQPVPVRDRVEMAMPTMR